MLAAAMVPRVEIAPNVLMPMMNFGVQNNHSMAIALGVRGLDTANVYGDSQQREVGASVRAAVDSGISRAELFVTTKIECCPGTAFGATTECVGKGDPSKNIQHNFDVLGLDYVDLLLLHWPCDDLESSLRTYAAMEPLVAAGKARAIGCVARSRSLHQPGAAGWPAAHPQATAHPEADGSSLATTASPTSTRAPSKPLCRACA
jgi:hypothetical protein